MLCRMLHLANRLLEVVLVGLEWVRFHFCNPSAFC